jgi:hypothetical protein
MKSSPEFKTCRIFSVSYSPFENDEESYDTIDFHVVAKDFYEALKKAEQYFEELHGDEQPMNTKSKKGKKGERKSRTHTFSLTKIELTKTGVIM